MFKTLQTLAIAALLAFAGLAEAQVPRVQGTITTQNLVPAGACTAGGCVEIDVVNKGVVTVQVTGTYTGALSGQVTTDGATWVTLAPTPFAPFTALGTPTATIASAATGAWQVSAVAGALKFRVTALAAVTGTATITLQSSPASIGSSGGGGGGAVTVADGADTALGATTDGACAGDATSGCTVESRLIRIAQNLTTAIAAISAASPQLVNALGPQTPANSFATFNAAATGAQTSVNDTASDTTCLAANAARKGATIANDSSSTLYLLLANATSSATAYTVRMAQNDYYEVPYSYTGVIKCIWSSDSTGAARVTEITN